MPSNDNFHRVSLLKLGEPRITQKTITIKRKNPIMLLIIYPTFMFYIILFKSLFQKAV